MPTSADAVAAVPPLRVLCLHGWAQDSRLFRRKTSKLYKKLRERSNVELVFASAPHVVPRAADPRTSSNDSARSWFHTDDDPRAIRNRFDRDIRYRGYEDSAARAARTYAERGCSGIMGFSQGAAMSHYLCALSERKVEPWGDMKFGIFVGGAEFACVDVPPRSTIFMPTLHVSGSEDAVNSPPVPDVADE